MREDAVERPCSRYAIGCTKQFRELKQTGVAETKSFYRYKVFQVKLNRMLSKQVGAGVGYALRLLGWREKSPVKNIKI